MKQLILIRHGKSSWDYQVSDKDRPLKEKGIADAQLVAGKFKELDVKIDFAYSSPANRAFHTGMIFLRTLPVALKNFRVEESLYDFSGDHVQNFVKTLNNAWNTVLIFGHNHALTTLANRWGNRYIENVPTAGLVHIVFDVQEWSNSTKGITKNSIFPKHLKP